ncbi:MAG TPA: glycosyltransferase, partial [Oligoflexia bacterium]|nr:glycosyltransferase [Oligoflexia bacterium]
MQNRPNAVTHPGGDTVVMEKIAAGVRALGHQVEIDLEGRRNPADHDVVHLFNFATPELTETFARRAHGAGVPMVVTTLYEDWPSFYNQMSSAFSALEVYAGQGQVRAEWRSLLEEAKKAVPHAALNNSWTAQHAQVLMATGEYEVRALRRDYPAACSIETCCYGSDLAQADAAPDLFRRETGLVDFVLCVGRLERRKNQAMLLKALEDDDLPLVFAGGGFTYQQDYEALCRKFRRRGRTVFLGRLSPEMLSSAYAAARVHVLPSWFELPGLVSLEAACAGANIVVTGRGTARDYFGDYAYYCEPDDDESIRNAVLAAYYQPRRPELAAHARQFTWEASAERHSALYLAAIRAKETAERRSSRAALGTAVQQSIASSTNITNDAAQSVGKIPEILGARREITGADGQALQYCTLGDNMIKQNRYAEAEQEFRKALQCVPDLPRALRGVGVSCLTQQKVEQAETYFRQALKFEPQDVKSMLGLGAVAWARQEKQEAFSIYLRAAEVDPAHPSTILYLVNAAYELKRLPELERALQGFLNRCPDNMNIQYCLAGCCFAQMKYAKASGIVERILQIQPGNEQALELRAELEKKAAAMHGGSAEPSGGTASLVP